MWEKYMLIKSIKINNFRNLNNIEIELNPITNYIIGENNLGKSNFLDALDIIFNGKRICEDDYSDINQNIEIIITLILNEGEYGFFADNFDPEQASEITFKFTQSYEDLYPIITCLNTDENIQSKQLKKIHYIRYQSSTVVPSKELRLTQTSAAAKVFNGIVDMYLSDKSNDTNFINQNSVESLSKYVNELLSKVGGFSKYGIKATIEDDINELISNMYFLSDGDRKIESTGSGVQYIAMTSINILGQIMGIYKSRGSKFDEQYYIDENGRKILPILVALDEPEVHLHPYLQRALISYYKKILSNEDQSFNELIKKCFGLDGISGQLIAVTHSPDILADDYKNLVRFYKCHETTMVASGYSFRNNFDKSAEKQLVMRFKDLRESFYAHCVVIVEGETEYGCMPYFADNLNISLDDYCISVIMAQGESSIKPLITLFKYFHIPTVCIYDGDVKGKRKTNSDSEFFTDGKCFEIDIVNSLFDNGRTDLIKTIAEDMDGKIWKTILDKDYVAKGFNYLEKSISDYLPKKLSEIDESNKEEFCTMYEIWFMKHKGVLSGRSIGMHVPAACIPKCYSDAFRRAIERSLE